MSGQVPKLELKYWKLRARKLTLHLINVAEINAQQNYRDLTRILTIHVNFMERYFPTIKYLSRSANKFYKMYFFRMGNEHAYGGEITIVGGELWHLFLRIQRAL